MEENKATAIPGLKNIKRVVVLMFENRSFDHIFGALPGVNGLFKDGAVNRDYYNLPDPLQPPSPSNPPVYPAPIDPYHPMARDFNHDFGDGMMPDLYGPTFTTNPAHAAPSNPCATFTSGYANGAPTGQIPNPKTYPETNSGFYSTFQGTHGKIERQGQASLTYFEDGKLKVLHALAKNFIVCDNWHCDMPGHTLPNRTFIHCGTTGSVQIDDTDQGQNNSRTIFQVIDRFCALRHIPPRQGWKMYTPASNNGGLGQTDLRFLNFDIQNSAKDHKQVAPITEFADDCKGGTLPLYSFIMCWLPGGTYDDWEDTSMHPNSLIQPGENLLAAIYNTLRATDCWQDTLLIVTFDENGGIYDHVFPPQTTPPNSARPVVQQSVTGCCGTKWILNSVFDFALLGLRVPALLISPWLKPGIDSNQYQNTSVLRFLIDRLNDWAEPSQVHIDPLTLRDKNAPSLESAFAQFGLDAMRHDCPERIEHYKPSDLPGYPYQEIPYGDGKLTVWTPPEGIKSAPPVSYVNELLDIYVASLPGHPDSGKKIARSFATNAEVASYLEERLQAAGAAY